MIKITTNDWNSQLEIETRHCDFFSLPDRNAICKTNGVNDNRQMIYRWLYEGRVLAVARPWGRIIPIQLLKSTKDQRFVVRNTRATPEPRCRAIGSQTLHNEILSFPRLPRGRLNASHGRDPPAVPPLQIDGFAVTLRLRSLKGNHKVFILHYAT